MVLKRVFKNTGTNEDIGLCRNFNYAGCIFHSFQTVGHSSKCLINQWWQRDEKRELVVKYNCICAALAFNQVVHPLHELAACKWWEIPEKLNSLGAVSQWEPASCFCFWPGTPWPKAISGFHASGINGGSNLVIGGILWATSKEATI